MKKFNFLVISLLAIVFACTTNQPEVTHSIADVKAMFANPPSEYRSAPLWDWNEQISKEGIDFHMKEFKKAGIGGVFVHPRPGLLTNYLSEEWFSLFDYTVQKGKELDMKVWIYDENSYPSGFAGGHVPAEMPDSYKHGASLSMDIVQDLNGLAFSDTIEVILKQTDNGFTNITSSYDSEKGKSGTFYIFRKKYPGRSSWYGGFPYVDLLYKGVTEKFLEVTMKKGYEKNQADFGKTLPGVFTDEPNLEAAMSHGAMMRWTPDLWEVFEQRWGYDLKPHLPSLAEEVGNWKKVRHDYIELLLEMFIDRWAKPWSKYCDENGLMWTGHYWEHGWPVPTDGIDEAAFYIWHQMPGVDMLGNMLEPEGMGGQFGNNRAVNELRSAANQAGRKRTLSETYGGAGWDLNFQEQKRLVDWQGVLGVNFVNQHLSYYSLNGVRKYDYPPSFSYHEPWWEHYHILGDYIGRISMATSVGLQFNNILVLQPNTTAWMYFSRTKMNRNIYRIQRSFKKFIYQLDQKHLEYDLGSEYVLRNMGSVNGSKLTVGQRNYNLVVIPAEMDNIDLETFHILESYLKNGGKVLSFIQSITMLDGDISDKVDELSAQYKDQWIKANDINDSQASQLLVNENFNLNDISANGNTYHQRRILADGELLFIANTDQNKESKMEVTQTGKYVSFYDLISGKIYSYPSKSEGGKVIFSVDLPPVGSALFITSNTKPSEPEYVAPASGQGTEVNAEGKVKISRDKENVLVVNFLDIKAGGLNKKDVYFMSVVNDLYKEKGIKMGNPWQHKIQYKDNYLLLDTLFKNDKGFTVDYHFNIKSNTSAETLKGICAVVERPALWQISINGKIVNPLEGKYWIEKAFPVFSVGEFLKAGKNTLTITAKRMNIHSEVMPVYLIGDFAVKPGKIGYEIAEKETIDYGSWVTNGMPFYSQSVTYTQSYNVKKGEGRYKVKLDDFNASVSEVFVNGKSAGLIAWKPDCLDITELLKDGNNEVSVKVFGSLKSSFGFFFEKGNSWIYGPFSWDVAPKKLPEVSDYFFNDYGLMKPFSLVNIAN